jgi:3-keto-5-aminohexanoate cleavage enzyme
MKKMIITAALTGSVTTKEQSKYLPVTPEAVAEEALRAYNEGASIVHLHARDPNPAKDDVEVLGDMIQRINDKCPVITQVGTGARDRKGEIRIGEERLRLLDIKPKPHMETINAGTFTFQVFGGKTPPAGSKGRSWDFSNAPELIEAFAVGMKKRSIAIEFEAYDIGHLLNIGRLVDRGILKKDEEIHINLVTGIGGGIDASPKSLMHMLEHLPPNTSWGAMGIGQHEFPMITLAMILGGNVRVGLEDNLYVSRGVLAKSNGELVAKAVRIAKELGREVATLEETKQMLGIK